MTRKRRGGYIFETYSGDHPPLHVHILERDREVGRWDIENQRPMDDFEVTRRLRNALRELGYLLEIDVGPDD